MANNSCSWVKQALRDNQIGDCLGRQPSPLIPLPLLDAIGLLASIDLLVAIGLLVAIDLSAAIGMLAAIKAGLDNPIIRSCERLRLTTLPCRPFLAEQFSRPPLTYWLRLA